MLRTSLGVLAIPCLLALGLSEPVCAQQVFGNIFGTVTDASGAGVPNAKVSITDQDKGTKFESVTNQDGNYTRDRLIPGAYTVEVEVAGFRKAVSKDVRVSVDQGSRVDIKLEIGDVTQWSRLPRPRRLSDPTGRTSLPPLQPPSSKSCRSFERNAPGLSTVDPGPSS